MSEIMSRAEASSAIRSIMAARMDVAQETKTEEDQAEEAQEADVVSGTETAEAADDAQESHEGEEIEAEEGEEDDAQEDDAEDVDEEEYVTVKVDGKESDVPLADLIRSYQENAAAENRLESAKQAQKAAKEERERWAKAVAETQSAREQYLAALNDLSVEPVEPDFDKIEEEEGPEAAIRAEREYRRKLRQAQARRDEFKAEQEKAVKDARERAAKDIEENFLKELPEYEEKPFPRREFTEFVTEFVGLPASALATMPARLIRVLEDARRYPELLKAMKEQRAAIEAEPKPKRKSTLIKRKARQASPTMGAGKPGRKPVSNLQRQVDQVRGSGSMKDFSALIQNAMKQGIQ